MGIGASEIRTSWGACCLNSRSSSTSSSGASICARQNAWHSVAQLPKQLQGVSGNDGRAVVAINDALRRSEDELTDGHRIRRPDPDNRHTQRVHGLAPNSGQDTVRCFPPFEKGEFASPSPPKTARALTSHLLNRYR